MTRHLTPEEAVLWRRVMATVRPYASRPELDAAEHPQAPQAAVAVAAAARPRPSSRLAPVQKAAPGVSLDASWDRKLASGIVRPDSVIDLHGHTLDTAYAALDAGLERAIAGGDRILLLVTGKPPAAASERPHLRGRIRAAIGDWLAASRHAAKIAAVRNAHPRHGGAGALYIVIRRARPAA